MTETVIVATPEELVRLAASGEVGMEAPVIDMSTLFNVLLEHYGYEPGWPTSDVY